MNLQRTHSILCKGSSTVSNACGGLSGCICIMSERCPQFGSRTRCTGVLLREFLAVSLAIFVVMFVPPASASSKITAPAVPAKQLQHTRQVSSLSKQLPTPGSLLYATHHKLLSYYLPTSTPRVLVESNEVVSKPTPATAQANGTRSEKPDAKELPRTRGNTTRDSTSTTTSTTTTTRQPSQESSDFTRLTSPQQPPSPAPTGRFNQEGATVRNSSPTSSPFASVSGGPLSSSRSPPSPPSPPSDSPRPSPLSTVSPAAEGASTSKSAAASPVPPASPAPGSVNGSNGSKIVGQTAGSCKDDKSEKVVTATSTRMCVLSSATAQEGLIWNAVGPQVSYSQAQRCLVARCPDGVRPDVPGVGPGGIITERSARQAIAQNSGLVPNQPVNPVLLVQQPSVTGRRMLGVAAAKQDVLMFMHFAAACFVPCD